MKNDNTVSKKAFFRVFLSALLWGTYGTFVTLLERLGTASPQIVEIRLGTTALTVGILICLRDRKLFRIHAADAGWFLANGIASISFFTLCYTEAIHVTKIATAVALLYTAPAIVLVLSILFFHEKLNTVKAVCIPVSVIGCALVSGAAESLFGQTGGGISVRGLLLGLGAGLGYALYSIFSRIILNRGYSMLTCVFYSFFIAALFVPAFTYTTGSTGTLSVSVGSLLLNIVCGVVTGAAPYLLYTRGMQDMENSRASQIATVEPVVSATLGFLLFGQRLSATELCGMALVIGAVLAMNGRRGTAGKL
ncbi:MAG: DMT family transporter [Lachnospiraceae bacterium]|jgi:DME family drug/metabolite transporter|nr:DMT family transporter [Lachnospiraceae bacterium]